MKSLQNCNFVSSVQLHQRHRHMIVRQNCNDNSGMISDGVLKDMSLASRILEDNFWPCGLCPWPWALASWIRSSNFSRTLTHRVQMLWMLV